MTEVISSSSNFFLSSSLLVFKEFTLIVSGASLLRAVSKSFTSVCEKIFFNSPINHSGIENKSDKERSESSVGILSDEVSYNFFSFKNPASVIGKFSSETFL